MGVRGSNGSARFQWECEAPAELAPQRFGRSLTLPVNELLGKSRRVRGASSSLLLKEVLNQDEVRSVTLTNANTLPSSNQT